MSGENIRESVIAGTWYPSDPVLLEGEVAGYLDRADPEALEGVLAGLVVPHAGYVYSGGVAAWAYKLLSKTAFDRVIIMAPSHRAAFSGASITAADGYRTPLGVVPLDHELIGEFSKHSDIIQYNPRAESGEHSLEIQLPFLQVVLGGFKLTPLLMGTRAPEFCERLAETIARICRGKRILMIASSDLSHYHPAGKARRLDEVLLKRLEAFDPEGLALEIENQGTEACGAGPIMTLMHAARRLGANRCKVLHYANSGDVTGDGSAVVGYGAAAIYGEARDG